MKGWPVGGQGAAGGGRPGERPGGHRGYRLTFFRLFHGRPTPFAMFGGDFWRAGREGGGGQLSLLAPALAELGGSRIKKKSDFARYYLLFLTMGLRFVSFAFRGTIYKVGVSCRRGATF